MGWIFQVTYFMHDQVGFRYRHSIFRVTRSQTLFGNALIEKLYFKKFERRNISESKYRHPFNNRGGYEIDTVFFYDFVSSSHSMYGYIKRNGVWEQARNT